MKAENSFAQQSALADGNWYRFGVTERGIYKIDYNWLKDNGINPDGLDPKKIRIFGQGNGMLPQANAIARHNDIQENTIFIQGEDDGKFNNQDFILFYGQSSDKYEFSSADSLIFEKNLYSDTAYYFLNIGTENGKRISERSTQAGSFPEINSFNNYGAFEEDLNKVINSGREWYGKKLAPGQVQDISFPLGTVKTGTQIKISAEVVNTATVPASFDVFLNGNSIGKIEVEAILDATYAEKAANTFQTFTANADLLKNQSAAQVSLQYNVSGSQSAGYLNRLMIEAQSNLSANTAQTFFRSIASLSNAVSTFSIEQATQNINIWDVTQPLVPVIQKFNLSGTVAKFSTPTQTLKEFVVFKNQDFLIPTFTEKVLNQNIKEGTVPNLIIVTHPNFVSEAKRLANFRKQHDQLEVKVVTTQQVYNEFSSGTQDITAIRDYAKYWYDQDSTQMKSLLLFGRGSYDPKYRLKENTNLVPTYESRNSVHPIYSYSSDDYYGFMETNEGEWDESQIGDHTMDIGVGRLPVKSIAEAATVVDKLIDYSSNTKTLGSWRNKVIFVADDGDNNRHLLDAEELTQFVDTTYQSFNIEKIYLDVFKQEPRANGEAAPLMNDAIKEAVDQGALIVNYTGHGGEQVWAHESVLTLDMINKFNNKNKLPFFVTATCEFGRQDDPLRISGAEQLLLSGIGGAIGLVTTARPVFSSSNFKLNQAFYRKAFEKTDGNYHTLGEIFSSTKNNGLNGPVNRNFSLLGDPSMRLAYPEYQIILNKVENISQNTIADTVGALSKLRLSGSIIRPETGKLATQFEGNLEMVVFDKQSVTKTLGNESSSMQFEEWNSVIHRGRASISGGSFTIEFVMPKNIVYQKDHGKISLYAWRTGQSDQLIDANGANTSLVIGGTENAISEDTTPPAIELFMDDESFQNGGITGSNTMLIADLEDENGINISLTGIGQSITATLINKNSGEASSFVLNDYYATALDTYQKGKVQFPINDLAPGNYSLKLKAWDTYNNPGEASIDFVVIGESEIVINNLVNYPNPFDNQTTFRLDHNQAGDHLSVSIDILNGQGQAVQTLVYDFPESTTQLDNMVWDGTNLTGYRLTPGMYIARVQLQSLTTGLKTKKFQKLLKIN